MSHDVPLVSTLIVSNSETESLQFDESLSEEVLDILLDHGLKEHAREEYIRLTEDRNAANARAEAECVEASSQQEETFLSEREELTEALRVDLVQIILRSFRSVHAS